MNLDLFLYIFPFLAYRQAFKFMHEKYEDHFVKTSLPNCIYYSEVCSIFLNV